MTGARCGRRAWSLVTPLALGTLLGSMLATPGVAVSSPQRSQPAATVRARTVPSSQPTSMHLVVGTADRAGGGYWLAASNGGVFAFGAPFYGSAGAVPREAPVVGMAATGDGAGYWLVAADGGVFAFGDARFAGSMGGQPLDAPVVGMAATAAGTGMAATDGAGYWLVAADGGVFAFDAPFEGSAAGHLRRAAAGLGAVGGTGYRIVSADGGVFAYGNADFLGGVFVPPMVGEIVAIDPGHDGENGADPGAIDAVIDGGGFLESCDTAGTETAAGYPEHAFTFDVGVRLQAILQEEGAAVVMTRTTDIGVGPCVNVRAAIGNAARADAAISIHADGGPAAGRGFDVIEPAPVVSSISDNRAIVSPSAQLAADVDGSFAADTGEPASDYAGAGGIDRRSDLGGLDLSVVPKVLVECANMQNATDAGLTEDAQWRQQAAQGLADGIAAFLVAREVP